MTDVGPSRRRLESPHNIVPQLPRPSEAIRKRVNERLASQGTRSIFYSPEVIQTSYSAESAFSKSEVKDSSTPMPPTRELKGKKPPKAENRSVEPVTDASVVRKGRLFVTKRPHLHYDSEHIDDRSRDNNPSFPGPIAGAEFDRLRKEVQSLKEALHESKRTNRRQSKKFEETRNQLNSTIQVLKDKEAELTSVKKNLTEQNELVSTIESTVQCQICMDNPDRPFALAPCGHILCLACLQEWFRKAPPALDDLDIDPEELTDPQYILMRSKSCPSCRAVVKHKPVPVFMVRAITSALRKAKTSNIPPTPQARDFESSGDPWKGIFPSSEEEDNETDEDYGSSTGDSDSDSYADIRRAPYYFRRREIRRAMFRAMYSSAVTDEEDNSTEGASDSDHEEQLITYIRPRWAPPSVDVGPSVFDISTESDPLATFKLLQRGCTLEMVQNYDLSYDHSLGIILSLRSLEHLYLSDDEDDGPVPEGMHRVFLGWNITLDDHDDDGEIFVSRVLDDIRLFPFKWEMTPRIGVPGALDARRLMPSVDVADYDTTDTEVWLDSDN